MLRPGAAPGIKPRSGGPRVVAEAAENPCLKSISKRRMIGAEKFPCYWIPTEIARCRLHTGAGCRRAALDRRQ